MPGRRRSSRATSSTRTSKDSTLKVGDILTLEGGTGKSFLKKVEGTPLSRITTVGLAYYAQFKVTADSPWAAVNCLPQTW
jgi:hypothetical protein